MTTLDLSRRSFRTQKRRPLVGAVTCSRRGAPNRVGFALLVGSLWFVGACAMSPSAQHTSVPANPSTTHAVLPPGLPPIESPSLTFARKVLAREGGDTLNAEQCEVIARTLAAAQEKDGLPVIIALAIMQVESGFNPIAKGPAGSIGLMQLQPATARETANRIGLQWRNGHTLLDPEQNARLGLAYLSELRDQFGTTDHAVAAFNIGPGGLRRLLARHPLRPGPYLKKVYAHAEALRLEYAAGIDLGDGLYARK